MFVLLAVIIGLIIGFIRGGSFKGFKAKKISLLPLGIIGGLMQLGLHLYFYTGGIASIDAFLPVINFVSYILILITLVFNLDDFWTIMMTVGIIADFVITFLSGGKMPVALAVLDMMPAGSAFVSSISDGTNALYAIMDPAFSKLWILGINLPVPFAGAFTQLLGCVSGISVGGILVFIGLLGWVQYAMNRSGRKDFTKDDVVEDLDYIIPPEEEKEAHLDDDDGDFFMEDDEEDYFFEEEDDFYDEEDEAGMTARIPQLTPEAIAQFTGSETGLKAAGLSDSKEDTKVFTAIRDLGAYEARESAEAFEASDEEETPVSGFFTQSFYAEKEKGKLAFGDSDRLKEEIHIEPEEEGQKAPVVIEPSLTEELKASAPAQTPVTQEVGFTVQDNKIVTDSQPQAPVYEQTMTRTKVKKERHTEEEMRSIWQQMNQEDEKVRARKRRRVHYADVKEPFKAEREKTAARKAVARAATGLYTGANPEVQPIYREITPPEPEVVQPKPVQRPVTLAEEMRAEELKAERSTEIFNPKEVIRQTTAPEEDREATMAFSIPNIEEALTQTPDRPVEASKVVISELTDEERRKAGYERIKVDVNGEEVSFWRKRKDTNA